MEIYQKDGMRPWAGRLVEMGGKGRKIWLCVDENLAALVPAFKDAGFRILTPPQGMPDDEVKELAEGTLLVTKNSKDFLNDAAVFDYDVIGIEAVKFIDREPSKKNQTVRKVIAAISASKIWHLTGHYYLEVKDDGGWEIERLD